MKMTISNQSFCILRGIILWISFGAVVVSAPPAPSAPEADDSRFPEQQLVSIVDVILLIYVHGKHLRS